MTEEQWKHTADGCSVLPPAWACEWHKKRRKKQRKEDEEMTYFEKIELRTVLIQPQYLVKEASYLH